MKRFFLSKTLETLFTLLILITAVFFLLRLAPGGPFDTDRAFPPEVQAAIQAKYGLDLPLYVQYFKWLGDLARGSFGTSFQYLGVDVGRLIGQSFAVSFQLGLLSLFFGIGLGIPAGAYAAWKKGSAFDHWILTLTASFVSLPSYLVGSILILIFSIWLNALPPALWNGPSSMVLPVVTLALRPLALLIRLTRASVIEALNSDYIRTAWSKGLPEKAILFKHALRNSLIPVVTLIAPITAALITGSFLVETIFQIPGMGKHFVSAVINRDYPVVMGTTLIYGVLILGTNFLVDVLYGILDPRIRVTGG